MSGSSATIPVFADAWEGAHTDARRELRSGLDAFAEWGAVMIGSRILREETLLETTGDQI